MKKGPSIVWFLVIISIVTGLCYTAVNGVQIGNYLVPAVFNEEYGVRKGLDLVGGSIITFEAQVDDSIDADTLAEDMDTVVGMLTERLTTLGYTEAVVSKLGTKRIQVEIPSISDPEEAVQKLGSTAQLEFVDADGETVLTGGDVVNATAQYGQTSDTSGYVNYVSLELSDEGAKKLGEVTAKYSTADMIAAKKNYLAIQMDGEDKSVPYFKEQLNETKIIIEGSFTADETKWLASIINSGSLPFSLKDIELRSVGPQLGERALETCLWAGLIGLILVMLLMSGVYRLPGVLSSIILVGYVALVGLILAATRANLSLPGIAGVVLSIGMAVDANVVIFERIKEELRAGKSVKSSVASGFQRAFRAILDSNITTIIAAGVLYYFGTGPIQGFAVTLFIGIVVSMFTAILVTRWMLNLIVNLGVRDLKAFGA